MHPYVMLTLTQVSTNYGRTAIFAPLHYRLNATVKLISISRPCNTITGLVAVEIASENPNPNRFIRIGRTGAAFLRNAHFHADISQPAKFSKICKN
ncbi:hypothetical protein UA08_08122 [Talaromyces atroroseus]|uniref:Uncharacterized protein n=1 Tax=Talaromyces atroroseus TaxID=1441469 RepID=A0A225ACH8_TALAT|nr:hypothetical protein UA08_08122 [Talaromyces atroroseus]OKL56583.1 hypothetical protein UA08_08122 [Talaromyces atroroseus]